MRTHLYNGHTYCVCCDPDDTRRATRKKYEEAFFAHAKGQVDVCKREFRVPYDPDETTKTCAYIDGIAFGDGIIVCIEVDEDGHRKYACDEARMHLVTAELLKKHSGFVVAWIRVNPTIPSVKNQWSVRARKMRLARFEEAVAAIRDALASCESKVAYIGFE